MLITPNLSLPYIDVNAAQREVVHNEAIRGLDALAQLAVLDRDLPAPPGSPADGERWIVASSPTGDWSGHAAEVAAWQDGAWRFYTPGVGWFAYVVDESLLVAWDGSAWVDALSVPTLQNMALLGIGTTADATNPFSAKLNNALWVAKTAAEGGDGDLRYKMSKESAAKTLSLLMQTNFSGRAEIGLTGDDDLHFKVSADGASWLDAIVIDRSTGKLVLGQGFSSPETARVQLYAAPFDALAFNGAEVNGNVDVSQELGTTGATLTNNTAKYTADQWQGQYNHGAATAVVTSGQVEASSFGAPLAGYQFGHRIKATTAITSIANGDFALHRQYIEGYRVAHYGWGAAGSLSIAIFARWYVTAGGVAFIRILNSAVNRAYFREVTLSAGWNTIREIIPGDTTGTWQKTASAGMWVEFFPAGKAASPATPNAWGTTPAIATTNSQNLLGTNDNESVITGFKLLPVMSGIELPSAERGILLSRPHDHELRLCQRYFYNGVPPMKGVAMTSSQITRFGCGHPVPMRGAPTLTLTANVPIWDGATPTVFTAMGSNYSTADVIEADVSGASGLTVGNGVTTYQGAGGNINVSARM